VFEKIGFRRISEPKREEVTGAWRKLHNEKLHQILTDDQIQEYKMEGECVSHERDEKCVQNISRKS
jgi:hypothetical protein